MRPPAGTAPPRPRAGSTCLLCRTTMPCTLDRAPYPEAEPIATACLLTRTGMHRPSRCHASASFAWAPTQPPDHPTARLYASTSLLRKFCTA